VDEERVQLKICRYMYADMHLVDKEESIGLSVPTALRA
jgi:hypothetical protein